MQVRERCSHALLQDAGLSLQIQDQNPPHLVALSKDLTNVRRRWRGSSLALLQEVGVHLVPIRPNKYESPSSPPGVLYLKPSSMGFSEHAQVLEGRSHALLQEAGVDLVAILQEEGFYVRRRTMSAPLRQRSRDTFGTSAPIEVPTRVELDKLSERCAVLESLDVVD